ncbi:MAG: hypothetical protein COA73_13575 [Candidatus Hydrogenedentota bacterium]|nr:MAG: hypothetical protein COA73_13575 [Candidatus Hydrogenedentota bacterium]
MNYLLNNLQVNDKGTLGLKSRALPAAEQFLLARYFMHRTVYYHKTTMAFEESCRQLIRRIRNRGQFNEEGEKYGLPKSGEEINDIASTEKLYLFDDSYIDNLITRASEDPQDEIKFLAKTILNREPPKLLKEICDLYKTDEEESLKGKFFKEICKLQLKNLATKYNIPLGMFLYCETHPLRIESRSGIMSSKEAKKMPSEEADESIQIFPRNSTEPKSIVDLPNSIIKQMSGLKYQYIRLYVVKHPTLTNADLTEIQTTVQGWGPT